MSVVRSETFADSNRPPAVELKQHQRVCRELDEWKQRALNAQRQLSQFTTFAGCEKLKESERIRSWAVVTVAAASKPDADGWRFINLFDVVTVAGIAVTPKDESDDALRQARSNAKSTASRAITFVEGCGVLERGDQIYFHDDEDDSNKITGSRRGCASRSPSTRHSMQSLSRPNLGLLQNPVAFTWRPSNVPTVAAQITCTSSAATVNFTAPGTNGLSCKFNASKPSPPTLSRHWRSPGCKICSLRT